MSKWRGFGECPAARGYAPDVRRPIRIAANLPAVQGVLSLHARHLTFWYSPSPQFHGA